jgi:hypothetical protein
VQRAAYSARLEKIAGQAIGGLRAVFKASSDPNRCLVEMFG